MERIKKKHTQGKRRQVLSNITFVRTAAAEDDKKKTAATSVWPNTVFKQLKLLYRHNGIAAVLKSRCGGRP